MASLSFYFASGKSTGVASRHILMIALFCMVYFGGACFLSCCQCFIDQRWVHFILSTLGFVFAVVILVVGLVHSNVLNSVRDFDKRCIMADKRQQYQAQFQMQMQAPVQQTAMQGFGSPTTVNHVAPPPQNTGASSTVADLEAQIKQLQLQQQIAALQAQLQGQGQTP